MWEIDTSTLTDGQDIPSNELHLVQVNAEDWQGKVGVGYIKVLPKPSLAKPPCGDLYSNVCEGIEYHKLVGASDIGEDPKADTVAWTAFLHATLPGGPLDDCVMAPVTSVDDLREIAIAAGTELYSYVGVRKSALDLTNNGSKDFWYNIDGTPVPNSNRIWKRTNNQGGLQVYAAFVSNDKNPNTGGKLDDIENFPVRNDFVVNKAVMKCCGSIPKTFC